MNHDEWFENDESADAPVQVRGLRKAFGKKVAVSDATFAIRDSEIFCLLGHNGAGKTTTMSMMTCLLYTSPSPRDRQKSRMPSSA